MMELEQALMRVYDQKDAQNMSGFAEGGTVIESETQTTPEMDRMLMEAQQGVAEGAQQDPNASLMEYIDELMAQRDQAEDPSERAQIEHMAEAAVLSQEAPMAPQAFEIASQGRGEDTALAHLRPGEVVLPPEMFEDPEFERMVESRFGELDLDPEAHVVGLGIASLNPITGLEEFGFFKKIARGIKKVVKKVVKPIAKVAQFIPGPWQPIAALANKAFTVYDVAKGRANPLSLLTVAGPLATGGGLGKNISDISKAGSGSFLGGLGKGLAGAGAGIKSGIGSLIKNPIGTFTGSAPGGGIPALLKTATYSGQAMAPGAAASGSVFTPGNLPGAPTGVVGKSLTTLAGLGGAAGAPQQYQIQSGDTLSGIAAQLGVSVADMMANNPHITDPNMIIAGEMLNVPGGQMQAGTGGIGGLGGIFSGGGADGVGNYGVVGDVLGGLTDKIGLTNYGGAQGGGRQGGIGGLFGGGGGGGGGFNLGTLGALGAAGLIGKLAYDEAKNMRGVPLTPLTQEGSTGRYNIEAEIARRMGKEAPNPVEFGLLPTGTIPTLSGGRRAPEPRAEDASDMQLEGQMKIPRDEEGNVFGTPEYSGNRGINPAMGRRPDGSIITLFDMNSNPEDYELVTGEPMPERFRPTSGAVMSARYGGPVMAFAEGGDVAMEDFKRMDGPINGPGTEVSDDIPAMLSDGEFVMTGRAVRGAGAFDLQRGDGGILTLTPNGSESRDKGTNLMYEMMELFSEFADKPKRSAA